MQCDIICGNCLDVLPMLEENSVDSVVTDPPYGLEFMGRDWDHGVPGQRFWEEIGRVAKPGAMLMAFGGTRTHHRLMVAIEDADWVLKDTMMWLYGTGFPKSLDISKAIDRAAGAEREVTSIDTAHINSVACLTDDNWKGKGKETFERKDKPATSGARRWDGWGTALKPAWEPIVVAMNPRDGTFVENALEWGVAGLWIDGGRIGTPDGKPAWSYPDGAGGHRFKFDSAPNADGPKTAPAQGRWPANLALSHVPDRSCWCGGDWSDCPYCGGSGVIPGCQRREMKKVRTDGSPTGGGEPRQNGVTYPVGDTRSSVDHRRDGTGQVADWDCVSSCPVRMLAEQSGERPSGGAISGQSVPTMYGGGIHKPDTRYGDTGTAARFFYTPKASKSERTCGGQIENPHPTVKPLEIVRHLVRLTETPDGGTVLDPFVGSGTTGVASFEEGRSFVGIEQKESYCEIARERMKTTTRQLRMFQ